MADFMTTTSAMPVYMIYPRFLMDMDLSETEKLVYVVLLDRARLSMSNGNWEDESGHVFLIYPIKSLAEALHKSEMTVKRALAVLEERGLIHRKRMGLNQANRIFVRLPIQNVSAFGEIKNALSGGNADDPPEGTDLLPLTERKCSVKKAQKCSTNKNDGTRTTEQERGSKEARSIYGQFKNVFLTEDDLERLRRSVPNYREYIERLSSYMASTGKIYKDHAATIQSWALRDKPAPRIRNYDYKEGESL